MKIGMTTMPQEATRENRRLTSIFVAMITAVVISALIFVACKERFIFIVPGIVFFMFTVAAIVILCQACCELVSRRWPKAVGFIRRARIERSYIPAGGMHAGSSSPSYAYSIDVEYDYAAGGKQHKGTRISFVNKDYNSRKEAERARSLLLKNKKTSVYYCPLIPSWSCITHVQARDIAIKVSLIVAASVVSLIFTLLAFYYLP